MRPRSLIVALARARAPATGPGAGLRIAAELVRRLALELQLSEAEWRRAPSSRPASPPCAGASWSSACAWRAACSTAPPPRATTGSAAPTRDDRRPRDAASSLSFAINRALTKAMVHSRTSCYFCLIGGIRSSGAAG